MMVQTSIESKLQALEPEELVVTNESDNHSVPPGSESHFRVLVVARSFQGQPRVARHRAVNKLLAGELAGGVHALAIEALTPEEWQKKSAPATSPECLGGSKNDPTFGRK
jgi:BolA protein